MIRNKIHYILIAATAALCGCGDFLERSAQNLTIPTTCADYTEILQGEGYFNSLLTNAVWLHLMTDDMELFTPAYENSLPYLLFRRRYVYQWRDEMEVVDEGFADNLFGHLYSQVLIANTCLDALPSLEGSDAEKDVLRGQALFHRAFAYLMLANLYAVPYDKATADTPCVPLKTTPTPSLQPYGRATFGEVYRLIENDIKEGLSLLKGKKTGNYYYIGYNAMLFVAMRHALYTGDFETALAYGEEILSVNDKLFDITDRTYAADADDRVSSSYDNFMQPANPEFMFVFTEAGSGTDRVSSLISVTSNTLEQTFMPSRTIEGNLMSLYEYDADTQTGDHRVPYWFIMPRQNSQYEYYRVGNYKPCKFNYNNHLYRQAAFRTAEAYLTVAESYARKASPDYGKALDYANRLRKSRIDAQAFVELSPADFAAPEDIVQFIWDERRRELCFEELHRWIDLRRTTRPEIIHPYGNSGYYKLEKDDVAYTLDFPYNERLVNPQNANPRPLRPLIPYDNN